MDHDDLMKETVLFERKYQQHSISIDEARLQKQEADESLSFEEIIDKITKNVEYKPLPERELPIKKFCKLAKEISTTYKIDIKISQKHDHIKVNYYFHSSTTLDFMKELIQMSDTLDMIMKKEVFILSLCYYTHAVIRNNVRIYPENV